MANRFVPFLPPGALDQDAAHGLGGRGEEVSPAVPRRRIFPGALGAVHQAEVGFVDQRGWLEGVARLFLGQLLGGQFT